MTHHTDAELLRDIEEHMRKMWDARLLPAVCWPTELAQRLTQAVRRAPAVPAQQKDVEKLRSELAEEVEAADNWRRLALQFDGHRMQAIGHLKAMLTDQQGSEANALAFIKAPPLHGDAVLAQRIAAIAAAPQPPEAEENPLQEKLDEALQSLEFYKRRCDLLQSIQPRMRDPERTMVCDVLANGHLLQGGNGQPDKARYASPEAAPVQWPEPVAWRDPKNFLPSQGCTYEKSTAKKWAHIYTEALYTEQQVRELLAANGIGKDKA